MNKLLKALSPLSFTGLQAKTIKKVWGQKTEKLVKLVKLKFLYLENISLAKLCSLSPLSLTNLTNLTCFTSFTCLPVLPPPDYYQTNRMKNRPKNCKTEITILRKSHTPERLKNILLAGKTQHTGAASEQVNTVHMVDIRIQQQ